jgi:hypothetical protein
MNIEYVKENKDLLKTIKELSDKLNHLSNLARQNSEHEERRSILNTEDEAIKKVKNIGELPYWYKKFHSNDGLSDLYRDFFSYFTDEDWQMEIITHTFYIQIELRKTFKDNIDAEELFNDINKKASSINRAIELEGFQTNYQIIFNGRHQCENNPKTHKNDIFKYKGFSKRDTKELGARVKFTII